MEASDLREQYYRRIVGRDLRIAYSTLVPFASESKVAKSFFVGDHQHTHLPPQEISAEDPFLFPSA